MTSLSPPAAAASTQSPPSDARALLDMTAVELDALFQGSPPGAIPQGDAQGTVIFAPGSKVARPAAAAGGLVWRGKVFRPQTRDLKNKLSPLSIPAIRAEVDIGDSWLDGRPCVVLDYSQSSKVAGWIRDEIREISPALYLGLVWGVGRLFGGRKLILRFALDFSAGA